MLRDMLLGYSQVQLKETNVKRYEAGIFTDTAKIQFKFKVPTNPPRPPINQLV
jgi:hypothetical protein